MDEISRLPPTARLWLFALDGPADALLADDKEKSEHLMLVDLARNDLLKVCTPGTVEVTEFMQVERFSHIMHLVSSVEGDLSPDATSIDVFRATFPAGTLSGAPKPRALEIIDELEPAQRGVYGGVVGYFGFAGDADLAIATARSGAAALFFDSSCSEAGSESATSPAPACTRARPPTMVVVRMAMARSRSPAKSKYPTTPP